MADARVVRMSGFAVAAGSAAFVIHIVLRSLLTAGGETVAVAMTAGWVPVNLLGVVGAALVLVGLPASYACTLGAGGTLGFAGIALIGAAWLFFGVFLSLYAALIMPWLAVRAPGLLAASAPLPTGLKGAFAAALLAWCAGAVLLTITIRRAHAGPRWWGYALVGSGIWVVVGDAILAPAGPSRNLTVNLISNLGPVLLMLPLGHLGLLAWRQPGPSPERDSEGAQGSSAVAGAARD